MAVKQYRPDVRAWVWRCIPAFGAARRDGFDAVGQPELLDPISSTFVVSHTACRALNPRRWVVRVHP